jgi:predicted nucleic acid-binding Zn ribbon protein
MTFCPKCGKEIKENEIRCIQCGNQLRENLDENRKQGKLLLQVGAFFLIIGFFFPIFWMVGFVTFGSGAIIYLTNRE